METPKPPPQTQGKAVIQAFKKFNEDWLMHLEIYDQKAKVAKAKFDAAVGAGFTETQALQICYEEWKF